MIRRALCGLVLLAGITEKVQAINSYYWVSRDWTSGAVYGAYWSYNNNWSGSSGGSGLGAALPSAQNYLNFDGSAAAPANGLYNVTNDNYNAAFQIYFKNTIPAAYNLYVTNPPTFYDISTIDPNIQNEGTTFTPTINFAITNGNLNGTFRILNINLNSSPAQGPLTFNGPIYGGAADANSRVINIGGGNVLSSSTLDLKNQTLTVDGPGTNLISGSLMNSTGSGKLVKNNTGLLTLTSINTYSGATTINGGELVGVTGGSCSNSAVTVVSGATNGVLAASPGSQWTCAGLTYGTGTTYADFNFANNAAIGGAALIQINGNLTLNGTLNIIIRGNLAVGTYSLVKYTGSLSGTPPATAFTLPAGVTATIVNNTGNKSIDLNVTANTGEVFWGVGNATWDTATANWKNLGGTATNYVDGDFVVFDDTASGASPITVTLNSLFTPAGIMANLTTKNYTISGSSNFLGNAALTKNGTGTLTIATTNTTFTGSITVNGGTLGLGGGASLGTGAMLLNNGTTVQMPNSGGSVTVNNPITIPSGAAVTFSTTALGNGIAGVVTSGDSTSTINISGSVSFSATTRSLDPFTGTITIPSGATLRVSPTSGTEGSANATFNVNGTLQPRNPGLTWTLGALTGSGTLAGMQTVIASAASVTYLIGTNNASTTFSGKFNEVVLPPGAATTNSPTAITKLGTGTLTLSGTSTNSGATTVNVGALIGVTGGSFSNSAVTVASGATNGVNITTPGNTWVCANLTYNSGTCVAVFSFGANTPSTTVAPLQVQNNLAINGTLNILISGSSTAFANGVYPLIKYTGTLSGAPTAAPLALPLGVFGVITNDTANKQLSLLVTNVLTPTLTWQAGTGNWDFTSIA